MTEITTLFTCLLWFFGLSKFMMAFIPTSWIALICQFRLILFWRMPSEYKRHSLCYYSLMKTYNWNPEKNTILKEEREISFEEIVFHIEKGDELDIYPHPNQARYPNQMISVVAVNSYAHLVPYIETEDEIFLKTIIPSRKATKKVHWRINMPKYKLDKEEQEILEAFDNDEIQPASNAEKLMKQHKGYASSTFKKDKRINIRLTSRDLTMIQKLALSEGIPYQTFIGSILHKFADGRYVEKQSKNIITHN